MKMHRSRRFALLLTCLTMLLTGCVREVIVDRPVPVEVPGPVQFVAIPSDLTVLHQKTTIPESATYGELIQLHIQDRAIIDKLLANIRAISGLGNNLPETATDASVE